MKQTLKKIGISLIIILIVTSFILPTFMNYNKVYAADFDEDKILSIITETLSFFVGLATIGQRLVAALFVSGANAILSALAHIGGYKENTMVSPADIFFNKIPILDIDFFDLDAGNAGLAKETVKNFRSVVATWYYVMRLIATAILLLVLIYVGIRMAISTIASEKAMYKKMLVDWISSIALIYLLHYFIYFIITINDVLVKMVESVAGAIDNTNVDSFQMSLMLKAIQIFSGFTGIICTIMYAMLFAQTAKYIFIYMKRMLTVGFLIIIAPLITVTYSLDKMGDGKAQALGAWLREFCYNVLIQPFHAILYVAFVSTSMKLLNGNITTLNFLLPHDSNEMIGNAILAIICLKFIDEGEKIIRKIFGFENASSLTDVAAAAAAVTTISNNAKNIGSQASKIVRRGTSNIKSIGNVAKNAGGKLTKVSNNLDRLQAMNNIKKGKTADKNFVGTPVKSKKPTEEQISKEIEAINNARSEKYKNKQKDAAAKAKKKKQQRKDNRVDRKMQQDWNQNPGLQHEYSSFAEFQAKNRKIYEDKDDEIQEKKATRRKNAREYFSSENRQSRRVDDLMRQHWEEDKTIRDKYGTFDAFQTAHRDGYIREDNRKQQERRDKWAERAQTARTVGGKAINVGGRAITSARGFVEKNAPGAMGLVAGGMALGTSGGVVQAMLIANGADQATEEFFKNSKLTQTSNLARNVRTMENITGQKFDQSTLASYMTAQKLSPVKPGDVQKAARDAVQVLASQLNAAKSGNQSPQQSKSDATNILNQVQNLIKNSNMSYDDAMKVALVDNGYEKNDLQGSEAMDKGREFMVASTNAEMAQDIATAEGMGMSIPEIVMNKHIINNVTTTYETEYSEQDVSNILREAQTVIDKLTSGISSDITEAQQVLNELEKMKNSEAGQVSGSEIRNQMTNLQNAINRINRNNNNNPTP
ncbi:MAG: hypothetical protein K6D97_03165 [Clostridia bacterium]|nr:hypothetical protein [Clostridia bacterium]